MGNLYASQFGDKAKAARSYLRGIKVDSLHLDAYADLARLFEFHPDPRGFLNDLRDQLRLDSAADLTSTLARLGLDTVMSGPRMAERIAVRPLSMRVYSGEPQTRVDAAAFYGRRAAALRDSMPREAERYVRLADSLLVTAIRLDSLNALAYDELSDLYLAAGDFAAAVRSRQRAEEVINMRSGVDGQSPLLPVQLAELLMKPDVATALPDVLPAQTAEAALNRALAIDSMYPRAHSILAELYRQREDYVAAARHYLRAGQSGFPEYEPRVYATNLLSAARDLQKRNDDQHAIEAAHGALTLEPQRVDAMKAISRSYYRLDRSDSARIFVDSAIAVGTRSNARDSRALADLLRMRADIAMRTPRIGEADSIRYVEADSLLTRAQSLRRDDLGVLFSRALVALARNDRTGAKAFVLKAIEASGSRESADLRLATYFYHSEAEAALENVLRDVDRARNTSTTIIPR
jgi:tetratricopeptide (TPR) repeat protein